MQRTHRTCRSAFTLIELLVVIAIIAILAAILFPVFAQAREKARQTACLSNTKQMALAVAQYTQDFDETLPLGGVNWDPYWSRWSEDLQPYIKNRNVFVCPSEPGYYMRGTKGVNCGPAPNYPLCRGGGGYAINNNIVRFNSNTMTGSPMPSRSLSEFGDAAGTFLISEAADCGGDVVGVEDPFKWDKLEDSPSDWQVMPPTGFTSSTGDQAIRYTSAGSSGNNNRRPIPRHNGGLNVVYTDGHAKWSRIDRFLGIPDNGVAGDEVLRGWPHGHPNNSWDNL